MVETLDVVLQRLLDDLVNYYDRVHGSLALEQQSIRPTEWLNALLAPWSEALRLPSFSSASGIASSKAAMSARADEAVASRLEP